MQEDILKVIIQDALKTKSIDLSYQNLSEIPQEIYGVNGLEVLDVSHNNIEEISQDILKLNKLKKIDLSNNSITEIPSGILEMDEIEILDISSNRIETLPNNFYKMFTKIIKDQIISVPSWRHDTPKLPDILVQSDLKNTGIYKMNSVPQYLLDLCQKDGERFVSKSYSWRGFFQWTLTQKKQRYNIENNPLDEKLEELLSKKYEEIEKEMKILEVQENEKYEESLEQQMKESKITKTIEKNKKQDYSKQKTRESKIRDKSISKQRDQKYQYQY